MSTMTYETINASINSVDWKSLTTTNTLVEPTREERVKKVAIAWRALRPLAVVFVHLPIVPTGWQFAGQAFIGLLDGLANDVGVTPDFKAGKDL